MRRIILLSLLVLLATCAPAQRRGGFGPAFRGGSGIAMRGNGFAFNRSRPAFSYAYAYAGLPYADAYDYAPQPITYIAPQPVFFAPPQPPADQPPPREAHAVITEYKQPAPAGEPAAEPQAEPQAFAIVLRNGSTVSATTIVALNGMLHYVDPDERHMQIALADVDRDATLQLNRARKLTLHLP